ncbi:MAG: YjbQ family protein [Deltaproteobacteria bacterium]|nr:YjbQ family protein [Deltaproteobacteria bacterium]
MILHETLPCNTARRQEMLNITSEVNQILLSKLNNYSGILLVSSPHTTAGITVNEAADPSVCADMNEKLREIVPVDRNFTHMEGNSDAHIKTAMIGTSVQLPVVNGKLVLGTWQGIFFCEYDGPRRRKFNITFLGDKD